ncbi:MAG: RHS repeat-associated core domain-containing protein [Pseudomonadales bacterium]
MRAQAKTAKKLDAILRQFDPATGLPSEILVQDLGYQTVQDLSLSFDLLGNLVSKTDQSRKAGGGYKNITETFQYDDLNRLDVVRQGGTVTLNMSYDALGNILSKRAYRATDGGVDGNADVGTYAYGTRPHAVIAAGSASYTYDANGSMISGDGRSIAYSVFNKPTSIIRGSSTVTLHYGPNRDRYRRIDDVGESSETETHYVGDVERIWKPGNVVVTKRYLGGEAIRTRTESSGSVTDVVHYLLKDHLGSTDLVTDGVGNIVQAQSFDAFGMRRVDDDYLAMTLANRFNFDTSFTTKGFTGHEGLDSVGLIHMNGRVYDPKIGRFVSADPYVQSPEDTQSLNRYSYVGNNPMSSTDPSGHFSRKFKQWVGVAFGAIVAGVCPQCFATLASGFFHGLGIGFAGGLISTGSVDGALLGAVSGAAFSGLGGYFAHASQSLFSFKALGSFGIVGGITSSLSGGKFGNGFVSAGLGTVVGAYPGLQSLRGTWRSVANITVAGTISEVSGGKFANGAAYAAFSVAIQGFASGTVDHDTAARSKRRISSKELAQANEEIITAVEDALFDGLTFETEDAASKYLQNRLGSIAEDYGIEVGARIYKVASDGPFKIARPRTQGLYNEVYAGPVPDGAFGGTAGNWHIHPSGNGPNLRDFSNAAKPERSNRQSYVSYREGGKRILVRADQYSTRWTEVK